MKTTEQLKKEFINYLTKCSNHTFVKGIEEWKRVNVSKGELKDFTKVFITDDGFEIYEHGKIRKLTSESIDKMIEDYKSNAKNQIKMSIFLNYYSGNKQLRSIRNNRHIESQIQMILNKKETSPKDSKADIPIEKNGFWSKLFNL
jgi:hypothetical protein